MLLVVQMESLTGFQTAISSDIKKDGVHAVILKLNEKFNARLGTEGYMLEVA